MQAFARRFSEQIYIHPTSDTAVLNLSRLIEAQYNYVASIPNEYAAETLIKKRIFYQSLEEEGVPHPSTFYIDEGNVNDAARKLSFPVFMKPSISPTFFRQFRKKGFIAYDQKELTHYVHVAKEHGFEMVAQEIVLGPPSNHHCFNGYFDKDSTLKIIMAKRKVRQPLFFSVSSALVSIPINGFMTKLKEIIVEYLASLKYRGCFSAEFKRDARDNQFKLLEVNARSTWYNTHESACGLNMVLTAYREAIGEPIKTRMQYESGVYSINTVSDFQSMRRMFRKGKLSLREVLTSYTGKRHFLIYAKDDPMPYIQRPHIEIKKKFKLTNRET
jgi:predicted ATP-grasp superfamily ATP-dependent carboligase